MTAIGNVLGVAQKAQDLQSGQLLIQRQQAELPAVQAQAGLTQNKISQQQAFAKQFQTGVDEQGNSLKGAGGEMDPAKVIAMQGRLAPLVPEIGKSIIVPKDTIYLTPEPEFLGVLPVMYSLDVEENNNVPAFHRGWVLDEYLDFLVLNPRGIVKISLS